MASSVSEQVYVFLATLYGGVIIGLMYDLYRIFRAIFQPKKIATTIQDLIFWIVISVVAIVVLVLSNSGQLRFYTFLGFALGCIIYGKILSRYVIRIIIYWLRVLKRCFCFILKMIITPVKALLRWMKGPWEWMKKKLTPLVVRWKRLSTLPHRVYRDMRKYVKTIMKKK